MRLIFAVLITAVLAFSAFTACKSPSLDALNNGVSANVPTPTPGDSLRISLDDAKKDFDAGAALFIDARAEVAYKDEHVKGAINIPLSEIDKRWEELPKDKKIIAYCS